MKRKTILSLTLILFGLLGTIPSASAQPQTDPVLSEVQGFFDAAAAAIQDAVNNLSGALVDIEQGIALMRDSEDPEVRALIGAAERALGRLTRNLANLQKVLEFSRGASNAIENGGVDKFLKGLRGINAIGGEVVGIRGWAGPILGAIFNSSSMRAQSPVIQKANVYFSSAANKLGLIASRASHSAPTRPEYDPTRTQLVRLAIRGYQILILLQELGYQIETKDLEKTEQTILSFHEVCSVMQERYCGMSGYH